MLPDVGVTVLAKALVIETIYLGNLSRLMVSSGDSDTAAITNFKSEKKRNSLNRVITTINVITHEEVVCLRGFTTNAEQLKKIMELTVDITTNGHGTRNILDIVLLRENITSLQ